MPQTCNDCRHFEPLTEFCRRYPPVVHLIPISSAEMSLRPVLPKMRKDERACGEFEQVTMIHAVGDGPTELHPDEPTGS
jgi:hypothetical protein